jgi:predicted class III extradiol MEMO1 family dioxygenase
LVNFLSKKQLGVVGQTQKIRAKVKEHGVEFQTKVLQTKLNYVKVVDIDLVWQ